MLTEGVDPKSSETLVVSILQSNSIATCDLHSKFTTFESR
jgi:hypothetical protein